MAADYVQKRQDAAAAFMVDVVSANEAITRAATHASLIRAADLTFEATDFEVDGLRHLTPELLETVLVQMDYAEPDSFVGNMLVPPVDGESVAVLFAKISP